MPFCIMKLYFLGTGTSSGVPQIGCRCPVCRSDDPRDIRTRTSVLLETDDHRLVLIDCGPDFRQQMLRFIATHPQEGCGASLPYTIRSVRESRGVAVQQPYEYVMPLIDAVLITHEHYDHVGGLDDLRPFSVLQSIRICAEHNVAQSIRRNLFYCFSENPYPGSPHLTMQEIHVRQPFFIGSLKVEPLRVMHGRLPIVGFKIGNMAYITDMTNMPSDDMAQLQGIRTLVVNALRQEAHPTHQSIGEAIAFARSTRAKSVYFIHMSHGAGLHSESEKALPENFHFAYDGQEIEV